MHPRLLFGADGLDAIRARALTPIGQVFVEELRRKAQGYRGADLAKILAHDPEFVAAERGQTGILGRLTRRVHNAATVYVATGSEEDGKVALELMRIWLDLHGENTEAHDWGNPWIAMSYDWLYNLMTETDRERARGFLATMVEESATKAVGQQSWTGGTNLANRDATNWTAIWSASTTMTNLAIEGEAGYNPTLTPMALTLLDEFLRLGISSDGALYEGLGYASGYGTKDLPYILMTLERRGVDLRQTTNLSRMPLWLSYEFLPWGYEGLPLNQSNGNINSGELLTYMGQRQTDPLSRWVFANVTGRREGDLRLDPIMGLLVGWPERVEEPPVDLPLGHWFSSRGLVFSRSGWGPRDAHVSVSTNPIGAGHSHADQGAFTLAANGTLFFSDGGVHQFGSRDHSIVLIDGKGQAAAQSRVEAYIRHATITPYADLTDVDQKLAYDRSLEGDSKGPFSYAEYNHVESADRQVLFVRGASGPLLVVSDELDKDGAEHLYTWQGQVPENRRILLNGRQFRIEDLWDGPVFSALEKGRKTTLVREGLKQGVVRGWALVRSIPHVHAWSSNNLSVNGEKCPYNTAYFGLGLRYHGWKWNSIKPNNSALIPLPDGRIEFGMESSSGGEVAMAVFTYLEDWEPGMEIPKDGGDFVVLTAADAVHSETPWDVLDNPGGVLDGVFLGHDAPTLKTEPRPKARTVVLTADRQATKGRFLSVMAPHDANDDRQVSLPEWGQGQVAQVSTSKGVDWIAGAVDAPVTGQLNTDARTAAVSQDAAGKTIGFATVNGTRLEFDGQLLLTASAPVQVVHSGTAIHLSGPGGATATVHRGDASEVWVNGVRQPDAPAGETVAITLPTLPGDWTVSVSDDGHAVNVTGNGPQPLWIDAPKTEMVHVNGVERYFIRDTARKRISVPLDQGCDYAYTGALDRQALLGMQTAGSSASISDVREIDPSLPGMKALSAKSGSMALAIPIPGPSSYRIVALVYSAADVTVTIQTAAGPKSQTLPAPDHRGLRVTFDGLDLADATAPLHIESTGPVALASIRVTPLYHALGGEVWSTIGPFPSDYAVKEHTDAAVKAALERVQPPETDLDVAATYEGDDGTLLRWHQREASTAAKLGLNSGYNFKHDEGVTRSTICYALTFVHAPSQRDAELRMNCDYWANVYVNGKLIPSDRSADLVSRDAAWFKGETQQRVRFTLHEGQNTLLIKVHGGLGSNSFNAEITTPGDLTFSPTPKND